MNNEQVKFAKDIKEPLTVRLAGSNTIDAKLLSDTIKSFVDIIEEAKNEISEDTSAQLQVEAFRDGSFIIDFNALFEILTHPKTSDFVTVATGIITAVIGIFKLADHLKGKKPIDVEEKTDEGLKITNSDGNVILIDKSVYNIYAQPRVSQTVSKVFDSLESDNSRDSITIKNKYDSITIDKEAFNDLSRQVDLDKIESQNRDFISRIDTLLEIKKVDLSGKSKWDFYYNKVISASIEDEDFILKVENSEYRFGSKDKLKVRLRETKEIAEDGSFIAGSERYAIEKVYGIQTKEDFWKTQLDTSYFID